ncbi:hypothetical protein CAPTEDRAFT_195544 [Capitella teleta]|uniref:RHD domain-containing protein n=1 Tax=Capitella teleta TaxID=283909 RepID=R7TRX0_CAPTE|nr:hypothetical protein CAPTEDRAFT_195544 [Capitella teleta]|eukprot:ELT94246.1 hypothetical protein CAPTEDRAFT_195544 [Capitella teleta]
MENQELKAALKAKDAEIEELKRQLRGKVVNIVRLCFIFHYNPLPAVRKSTEDELPSVNSEPTLDNEEIARYSRQLILPELGISGCIGLVDFDEVELSNLHRQILHTERKIGSMKSASVAEACEQ